MADGRMTLSEAILLGSVMHRQAVRCLMVNFHIEVMGQHIAITRTCALGAAAAAMGVLDEVGENFALLRQIFPQLQLQAMCPACRVTATVEAVIAHLNDDHELTREQIAEWVATVLPVPADHEKELQNA